MSDVMNSSAIAVSEEIRQREHELEALRAALVVLQSDRQPLVHLTTGGDGQFAISNVFVHKTNGNGEVVLTPAPSAAAAPAVNSRVSTARLLKLFDRRHARSIEDVAARAGVSTRHIAVGVLTRHGYLKKKGDGYVRTAKDYTA